MTVGALSPKDKPPRREDRRRGEPPAPILECGGLTPLFHPALDQPKDKPLREEVMCDV
jgi:hypothetical protein